MKAEKLRSLYMEGFFDLKAKFSVCCIYNSKTIGRAFLAA